MSPRERERGESAVYILDPDWLDDQNSLEGDDQKILEHYSPGREKKFRERPLPNEPLMVASHHFARRIAAQRSQFVVLGKAPDWLQQKSGTRRSRIRSVLIKESSHQDIRVELRACGITESVIFPDLDGLGREINHLWELMQHE